MVWQQIGVCFDDFLSAQKKMIVSRTALLNSFMFPSKSELIFFYRKSRVNNFIRSKGVQKVLGSVFQHIHKFEDQEGHQFFRHSLPSNIFAWYSFDLINIFPDESKAF